MEKLLSAAEARREADRFNSEEVELHRYLHDISRRIEYSAFRGLYSTKFVFLTPQIELVFLTRLINYLRGEGYVASLDNNNNIDISWK